MSSKLNIFITGATGYIGGSVLTHLLNHPNASSFNISALVRSTDKAEKLKSLGVDTVLGSYEDKDLTFLTKAASQADVVMAIANADILAAAEAILVGMKQKYEASGVPPILIHTSGSAVVMDDARGMHGNATCYSDVKDAATLDAFPETAPHRDVDIPIMKADKAGTIRAYLITPSTIFGYPSGPLVDMGVQNIHSFQVPFFIKASIARKQGGYLGKGLNSWPLVHVEDTADLYIVLLDSILKDSKGTPHGYYFVENGDYTGKEAAAAISEALVDLGVGTSREPSAFTEEEVAKMFGPRAAAGLSTNCYIKADRGRALGWKPKYDKADFLESIKPEVASYLKQLK